MLTSHFPSLVQPEANWRGCVITKDKGWTRQESRGQNKGAFPRLATKPLLTPLCRIDTDEDQWFRKFDVNDLITLWFYEGRTALSRGLGVFRGLIN